MSEFQPMSSEQLLARKRCCKSSCLHCPYGHTLKTQGLEIKDSEKDDIPILNMILEEYGKKSSSNIAAILLQEALGSSKAEIEITNSNLSEVRSIYLKNHFCGFLFQGELYLEKSFRFQGITLEVVKQYI